MSSDNLNNESTNNCNEADSKTSLIVNYLPQNVKEPEFIEMFAAIGPLKSAKLMYERDTGYSFGYGFVDYISPEDAIKAIQTYNGYHIQHKRLKVAFSRPNTSETKNTTLYFRNVPEFFDDDTLTQLVNPHGKVIQARIVSNPTTGKCRGIAFVIMSTKAEANKVIENLNGYTPEHSNLPLIIKPTDQNYTRRNNRLQQKSIDMRGGMKRPLLQSGPVMSFEEQWMYSQPIYGDYSTYAAGYDPSSMMQTPYLQFMSTCFDSPYSPVITPRPNPVYDERFFGNSVDFASSNTDVLKRPRNINESETTDLNDEHLIYVYGLKPTATQTELLFLFSPFGVVQRADLIMDQKTQQAKGYGFVLMETPEQASQAIVALDGFFYNGKTLQVRFRNQPSTE